MVATQGSSAVAATEWKTYNDAATGYRVVYPASWVVKVRPEKECAFKIDGMEGGYQAEFQARTSGGGLVVALVASPEQGWAKLGPIFSRMVSSFERAHAPAVSTHTGGATAPHLPSWQFGPLVASTTAPLQFGYPMGWQLEKIVHGDDIQFKMHGSDAAGKEAELSVWQAPRFDLTLDRFVETMEGEHFKPLQNFALASKGRRTVAGTEAVTHSITFTVNGVPCRMDMMFFVDREHVYCVGLSSATWSPEEMRNLMDRVAGAIRL
jgi:hypothetical protein